LRPLVAALAIFVLATGNASAALVFTFSGPAVSGTTPQGPGPYATATLQNATQLVGSTSYNGVLFTVDNDLIGAQEFLSAIAFNYKEPPDDSGLAAVYVSGNQFDTASFGLGNPSGLGNALGTFSLGYNYETANNPNRFVGGETSTIFVYNTSGNIFETNFNVANSDGFYSAIHVQGIGTSGNDSGKLGSGPPVSTQAVPEPASFATVGIGTLLGFGFAWRRRKRAVA